MQEAVTVGKFRPKKSETDFEAWEMLGLNEMTHNNFRLKFRLAENPRLKFKKEHKNEIDEACVHSPQNPIHKLGGCLLDEPSRFETAPTFVPSQKMDPSGHTAQCGKQGPSYFNFEWCRTIVSRVENTPQSTVC